jgi:uncharacterized phiE125 gp8 family phage protein
MALKLIVAPTPVVSLAEIKKHVRAEYFNDDDAYLESLVAVATDHIDGKDGWLGRAIGTQTWDLIVDGFPNSGIRIPIPPLQSVTSVNYISAATGLEVALTGFYVDSVSEPGWIMPPQDGWPTPMDAVNAVRIRFVAGYADVPAAIKHAIKLLTGHFYENRESVTVEKTYELPMSVRALLDKRRNFLH